MRRGPEGAVGGFEGGPGFGDFRIERRLLRHPLAITAVDRGKLLGETGAPIGISLPCRSGLGRMPALITDHGLELDACGLQAFEVFCGRLPGAFDPQRLTFVEIERLQMPLDFALDARFRGKRLSHRLDLGLDADPADALDLDRKPLGHLAKVMGRLRRFAVEGHAIERLRIQLQTDIRGQCCKGRLDLAEAFDFLSERFQRPASLAKMSMPLIMSGKLFLQLLQRLLDRDKVGFRLAGRLVDPQDLLGKTLLFLQTALAGGPFRFQSLKLLAGR